MHSNTIIANAIAQATHREEAKSVRRERLADMLEGGGRTLQRATATESAIRDAIELEEEMLRPEGEVLMDMRPNSRELFEVLGTMNNQPLTDDSDPLLDDSMTERELAELVPHEPVWNLFTLRNRVR
jgi:hypothetical protein